MFELNEDIKKALTRMNFVKRYEELSKRFNDEKTPVNDRLVYIDGEEVMEMIQKCGYYPLFDKKEKFYKIKEEIVSDYTFGFHIILAYGMADLVWIVKKNNKLLLGLPWGEYSRLLVNINYKIQKPIFGTYEDIEESYYDLMGVIKYAISLGYSSIYLQGHSLGATKVVYTYTKMKQKQDEELKNIKGILLLSLVDIPDMIRTFLKNEYLLYAEEKEKNGQVLELMPQNAFIHPISVKTYLKYAKYNSEIDFAQYSNENYDFDTLNKIDVPLFMRWGNDNEMILQKAEELVTIVSNVITNPNKDIDYVDGANHGYHEKEEVVAKDIVNFINKN